jgi:uncharacterized membrane protein YidH (DUF202 family)
MPRNLLGIILIAVGLALIVSARIRISRANRLREEQDSADVEGAPLGGMPPLSILFGGLAIIAGFLLWA